MRFLRTLLFPLLALTSFALARSSTGDSVLVLLDTSLKKENFSIFFGDLESTWSGLSSSTRLIHFVPPRREGLQTDLPIPQGHDSGDYQGRCCSVCSRRSLRSRDQEYVPMSSSSHYVYKYTPSPQPSRQMLHPNPWSPSSPKIRIFSLLCHQNRLLSLLLPPNSLSSSRRLALPSSRISPSVTRLPRSSLFSHRARTMSSQTNSLPSGSLAFLKRLATARCSSPC